MLLFIQYITVAFKHVCIWWLINIGEFGCYLPNSPDPRTGNLYVTQYYTLSVDSINQRTLNMFYQSRLMTLGQTQPAVVHWCTTCSIFDATVVPRGLLNWICARSKPLRTRSIRFVDDWWTCFTRCQLLYPLRANWITWWANWLLCYGMHQRKLSNVPGVWRAPARTWSDIVLL